MFEMYQKIYSLKINFYKKKKKKLYYVRFVYSKNTYVKDQKQIKCLKTVMEAYSSMNSNAETQAKRMLIVFRDLHFIVYLFIFIINETKDYATFTGGNCNTDP